MYQFELGLINYVKEMQKEREAKAAKKAEEEAMKESQKFMRNDTETKSQATYSRGGTGRD